jgi:hypothetical protein
MDANPYAPPTAKVADRETVEHGLKHRSVWLMIVFFFLTLGLYYPIWFFRRRKALNRLDSPRKVDLWPLLLWLAYFVIEFVLNFLAAPRPVSELIGPLGDACMMLLKLTVAIAMLVQCFRIRDIIQDHATPPADPDVRFTQQVELSGVMTFFFSIFYLQWAINKYIVGAEPRMTVDGARPALGDAPGT